MTKLNSIVLFCFLALSWQLSAQISTFPYLEDFEANDGGYATTGTSSSWAHGVPTGSIISSSSGCGTNAWVTNLSGSYNSSESSFLESIEFDFTALTTDPILRFDHIYNTESCCDEGWVEYSTNAGSTWSKLGTSSSGLANWYNDGSNNWWDGSSSAWRIAAHVLTGLAGEDSVKFRFAMSSDVSLQRDGFGVDNIIVGTSLTDPSIFARIQPATTSGQYTSTEPVELSVANSGTTTITTVQLCYNLDNGTPVCQTFPTNIAPTAIDTFLFTQTADLSMPGARVLDIYVGSTNDYLCNDSISVNITALSCLPATANVGTNSLSSTSAEVSWTENGTATSYRIEYDTAGYAAGTARNTSVVTDTFAIISGLINNSNYDWNVQALCSATDSSLLVGGSFFTGYCTPAPTSVDGTGITNVSFGTINNATGAEAGNYGDYSSLVGDIAQNTTATVDITLSTGFTYDTQIWVDWNDDLDFSDAGETVYSATAPGTSPTTLNATFSVPASATLGQHRMRIGGGDNPVTACYTGSYASFEDYTVNVIPTPACLAPLANAGTSSLSSTSAEVSWTENGTATSYRIEYDTAGYAAGTARNTSVVTDTFTILSGLMPETTYDWNVQALCSSTDSSALIGNSFTTPCGAVALPYVENFASYVPNCWTEAKGQLTANTVFTSSSSFWAGDGFLNNGSTGSARMNIYSTNRFEWLISPSIDLGNTPNTYRLEFDAGLTDFSGSGTDLMGSDDTLSVVISIDNGTTWSSANVVKLYDVNAPPANVGETVFIDLSVYTGTIKVGFYATSTSSNTDYNVYIDNFQVRFSPACPEPSANAGTNSLSSTSAEVSWTENGTATSYRIEYDTAGYAVGTARNTSVITDTFAIISGLMSNSNYDWNVQALCSATDSSLLVGGSFFTGYCTPAPTSVDGTGITNVSFDTINNATGAEAGNYGDYSSLVGDIAQNTTATVDITLSTGFTYDTQIWIDWNDDLDFSDAGETVYTATAPGTSPTTLNATFSVPASAPLGQHRMRIGGGDNPVTPCYTGSYASFEDYTVNVTPAPLVYYTIGTINTEDATGVADSAGVNCAISGTVVGVNRRGSGYEFTLIDMSSGSQEGITVFDFNSLPNYTAVSEGDSLYIEGDVAQFNGLTQFSPDTITLISSGNTIPAPIVVSDLDETTESKWLSIPTQWVSLSTSGSGSSNIDLTNGTDTILMRIDSDTDVNDSLVASGLPIVPGDTICGLFGIGGQFDNSSPFTGGYQIFPMRWSDLTICRLFVLPYYPIATINSEDATGVADSAGVNCAISGTVVGVNRRGSGYEFTLIDMSSGNQEGITVFDFNSLPNYTAVSEGDSLYIEGDVAQFNGLTQFSPDTITLISSGNTIPAPIVVSDLDETTESKWLSIPTQWVSLSTSGSGSSNIDLTNGTDTILMRIDSDTDVNDSLVASGLPIVPGDTICGLFGIGGQFDNSSPFTGGYQIFPMRWSDLTICRLSTGINDADITSSEIKLVPNPTNGSFEIRSNGFNNPTINISIRDIRGRVLSSEFVNDATGNFNKSFDLNGESSGVYFITILDGQNVINKKLILQ